MSDGDEGDDLQVVNIDYFTGYVRDNHHTMGLYANILITLLHNLEEFTWGMLQPQLQLKLSTIKDVDLRNCYEKAILKRKFFPLYEKISLLYGNTLTRGDVVFKLPRSIDLPLFKLLNSMRAQRNPSAHEGRYLYDGVFKLDIRFIWGDCLFQVMSAPAAFHGFNIDIPDAWVCPLLTSANTKQASVTRKHKHKHCKNATCDGLDCRGADCQPVPRDPFFVNVEECSLEDANVVLAFWKRTFYKYQNRGEDVRTKATENYIIELKIGAVTILYDLKQSQMEKLKRHIKLEYNYNYGHLTWCGRFREEFLLRAIAAFPTK